MLVECGPTVDCCTRIVSGEMNTIGEKERLFLCVWQEVERIARGETHCVSCEWVVAATAAWDYALRQEVDALSGGNRLAVEVAAAAAVVVAASVDRLPHQSPART